MYVKDILSNYFRCCFFRIERGNRPQTKVGSSDTTLFPQTKGRVRLKRREGEVRWTNQTKDWEGPSFGPFPFLLSPSFSEWNCITMIRLVQNHDGPEPSTTFDWKKKSISNENVKEPFEGDNSRVWHPWQRKTVGRCSGGRRGQKPLGGGCPRGISLGSQEGS